MEIKFIDVILGNYKFLVGKFILVFWNSSDSIVSLDGYSQRFRFGKKVFEDNVESIEDFIKNNYSFLQLYATKATKEEELYKSYNSIPIKYLVSKVEEKSAVLFAKIDLSKGYVAVTGSIVYPREENSIIEGCKDMWMEHFQSEAGMSEEEAENKFEEMKRVDGIDAIADISLFSDSFHMDGKYYFFESSSCGCLHDEIKKAFPDNKILRKLIKLHLAKDFDMTEAIWLYSQLDAVEDYRKEVIRLGKQIINPNIEEDE